jgi:hypothetical protein
LLEIVQNLVLLRRPVIEFGQISPYGLAGGIRGISGRRRDEFAAPITSKPARMADDQYTVLGSVIDDQIHDHAQPMPARGLGKSAQQRVVVTRLGAAETRVQPVIILDGV